MKKYDYSYKMSQDIINIDTLTFKDITISPDALSLRIADNNSYEIFVKYMDEIPIGFIGIMYVCTPHYEGAWIDLLAVCPQFQGKGIATNMISSVKDYISDTQPHIEFMSALIRSSNSPSLRAVEKAGFKDDGKGNFKLVFCNLNARPK